MNDARRKMIAFICGMHFADRNYSSLFDYTRANYYYLDYSSDGQNISVYDYERKCHVTGKFASLFDHGESGHIDFRVTGEGVVDVYDYKTTTSLQATCRGNDISLFDYKVGRYFEYQLS